MVARSRPDARPRTREESDRLLALAALCVVLTVALYVLFVRTRFGQRIDHAALEGRASLSDESVDNADDLLRTIDIASVAILGGGVVLVAVLRARFLLAAAAAVLIGGANITTQVLKAVLPRPELLPGHPDIGLGYTFPSGHTTVAASIAVGALLVVPRRLRGAVAVVGVLYAAAVGVATLTAGWHRPSEAIAAVSVVIGWGALAAWVIAVRNGPRGRPGTAAPFASRLLVAAGGGLCVATFVGLAAVLVARRLGRLGAVDLGRAYTSAVVLIVGAALLLVGLLLVALRPVTLDARRAGR